MLSQTFCACIAIDIKSSQSFEDKNMILKKLNNMAETLNEKYQKKILVNFGVRRGDELIGVVNSFALGYKIYLQVQSLAWKLDLGGYFGLGLGTLDTGSNQNLDEINGSAVINAFRARDEVLKGGRIRKSKVESSKYIFFDNKSVMRFYVVGDAHIPVNLINVLSYKMYSSLTSKQKETINYKEAYPDMTYEEIGIILGHQKNPKEQVGNTLRRARYKELEEMQNEINTFLIQIENLVKGDYL